MEHGIRFPLCILLTARTSLIVQYSAKPRQCFYSELGLRSMVVTLLATALSATPFFSFRFSILHTFVVFSPFTSFLLLLPTLLPFTLPNPNAMTWWKNSSSKVFLPSSPSSSSGSQKERTRKRIFYALLSVFVVTVTASVLFTAYSINLNKHALSYFSATPNNKPAPPATVTPDPNNLPWIPPPLTPTTPPPLGLPSTDDATLVAPLEELVKRLLPKAYHTHFRFTLRPGLTTNSATNIYDTFRLLNTNSSSNNPAGAEGIAVTIEGVTLSALGAGLNHYLKYVCKVEMTWSGDRFNQLPVVPPLIPAEAGVDGVVRASFVPWRYYMNVVTFGYTFAFWDWDRWQRELGMFKGHLVLVTHVFRHPNEIKLFERDI